MNENTKAEIIRIVSNELPKCKIYLFGSQTQKGTHKPADVDIALDNESKINFKILLKISQLLDESSIIHFVDIVDLNNISSEFYTAIKKDLVEWKK